MTLNLAQGIAELESGTLQNRLKIAEDKIPQNAGGPLVKGAHVTGDHTAGLVAAFLTLGLISSLEKAMPALGHSSKVVREGKELMVNLETGEIHKLPFVDPSRAKLLEN